jgi:hypothetical protein
MSTSTKKTIVAIISVLIIALGACVYLTKLVFSESLIIEPGETIKVVILVPSLLKEKALTSFGRVNYYYYSAGDGPKPPRNSINITLNKEADRNEIEQKVRTYFQNKGFVKNDKNELTLDKELLDISFGIPDDSSVEISLIYYH